MVWGVAIQCFVPMHVAVIAEKHASAVSVSCLFDHVSSSEELGGCPVGEPCCSWKSRSNCLCCCTIAT